MREVVLRLPADAVDEVLDRLLPLVPDGVREATLTRRRVELRLRGAQVPAIEEIVRAVGAVPHELAERTISDDWRERRLADYRAQTIGARLVVRPDWAPSPAPGLIDIALEEGAAFGVGGHPTTRTCLTWLLDLIPAGPFADLGCGSGVLAILAARLGWEPVLALDVQPASVDAARANAVRNGVEIEVAAADLSAQPAPVCAGFAANVPVAIHEAIVAGWGDVTAGDAPEAGLISGFGPAQADRVAAAYRQCGLRERRRETVHGWVVAELFRA
ncbi:MAG TPA: 50S ribosomal protein L11 methyltransferase [Solirubrobacteraceae bacterium]|jgi:ribosomal protein L11 methyltransferase|nr:50S ribosomal protein L11 methyltransferase [Solirubrobacteraceae bacterium]